MTRNLVKWKTVKCKSWRGQEDVLLGIPQIIDVRYRGTLLSRILAMPKRIPISLESAIQIINEKQGEAFKIGRFGDGPGEYGWYYVHFIEWMSALGYHIELTGDEFETYSFTDKIA